MGGFASLIGGLGNKALEYGEAQRNRGLQEWGTRQQALSQLIGQARELATTPERIADLTALQSKVLSAKPGDDPSKILQDIQSHLSVHPTVMDHLSPPPPKPQPGPAGPGETPGQGTLVNMIASPKPGGAAQPGTSPVQPQRQIDTSGLPLAASVNVQQQQAPPPVAASPSLPPIQAGPPSVMDRYNQAFDQGFMPPALARGAQPFLQNQAEFEQKQRMDQYLLTELGPQRMDYLRKNVAGFDDLPDYVKAQYATEMIGIQSPGMAGMAGAMWTPVKEQIDASVLSPAQKAEFGLPPNATGKYTAERNKMTHQIESIYPGWAGVTQAVGTTGEKTTVSNNQQMGSGAVANLTPAQSNPHFLPDINGGVNMYTPEGVRHNAAPAPVAGAVSPSMLPSTSNTLKSVTTADANGNPVTTLVPVQSTHTKGTAGTALTVPPLQGAGQSFEKPLTPEQNLKSNQQYDQYKYAEDRVKRILSNSHLLDSLIESGKLELALHDGVAAAIATRAMKLTPAESQMITDMNSLKESVNLIRGPLGATGFRGPEAFSALQAQRGNLLKNPDITRGVLQNLLNEMQNQSKNIGDKLHKTPQAPSSVGGNVKDLSTDELLRRLGGGK